MKAVIFDFDGVIADTMDMHAAITLEIMGRYGITMDRDVLKQTFAGVSLVESYTNLFADKKVSIEMLVKEKEYRTMLAVQNNVDPIEGIQELADMLIKENYTLAVATGSKRAFTESILKMIGMLHLFKTVVTAEDVKFGKPNPEIFLLAAEKLNTHPSDCTVIEDGPSGMIAAKNAGMHCIGLVNYVTRNYPADLVVTSLHQLTPVDFEYR